VEIAMIERPDTLSPNASAIIRGMSFDAETKKQRAFSFGDIERELADPRVFSWIDVQAADISALNDVLGILAIDLVLVSHFDRPEILPRIIERGDCLAFYLYEIVNPESYLDTSRELEEIELARAIVVLGASYIITFHRRRVDAVEYVHRTCEENFQLAGATPNFVAFLLMNRCLYDYAHLNLANDNYLDMLEESVLLGDYHETAERIGVAAANILALKRVTTSLHIVLMLLATKRSRFVSDAARGSYGDLLGNAGAVRASIDSSRDLLDGILGRIQADAANRTSDIARVLTVVSTIILPLSLIAGIYGMNFHYMPELETAQGYFVVLAAMAILAGALLVAFWRLGWLGSERPKP
jgi:magnesium transporter